MKKTAFKTFVCSFVLSLFTIYTVNKVFIGTPLEKNDDVKISNKNISLFLKNESPINTVKALPVAKIALVKPDAPQMVEKAITPSKKEALIAQMEEIQLPKEAEIQTQNPEKSEVKTVEIIREAPQKLIPLEILTSEKQTLGEQKNTTLAFADQAKPAAIKAEKHTERLLIPLERDGKRPLYASAKITINGKDAQNQVAMINFDKPIKNIVGEGGGKATPLEEIIPAEESKPESWQPMSEKKGQEPIERVAVEPYLASQVEIGEPEDAAGNDKNTNNQDADSPWVAAKGTNFPKNNNIKGEEYFQKAEEGQKLKEILKDTSGQTSKNGEVKVAGEIVKNILIPIPDEIMAEKNLTPQLISAPENKKLEDDLIEQEKDSLGTSTTRPETEIPFVTDRTTPTNDNKVINEDKKANEGGILKSITSIFSGSKDKNDKNLTLGGSKNNSNQSISEQDTPPAGKILPTEIRLSFQANKAEISGKTLKWLQAFAEKTKSNDYTMLEVRIDGTSSFELQQKRLNLLYNILTNSGLEYEKVNTIFTSREPNSFILRTVKTKDDSNKKPFDPASLYYRKW